MSERHRFLPLDRPVATLMLLLSLMVLGTVAIFELPLDFMPQVEPPFVRVEVSYPGSHPLENLRQIVEPLEAEIATVSGLESLGSTAEAERATIRAEFDWSANLDLKKLEVREAVERALPLLPHDIGRITYRTFNHGPSDGAILEARIAAQRDLSESWDLLDERIKRPLERIQGVGSVELGGVEPQQVRVEVDPAALRRHGVLPRELVEALEGANLDFDVGVVRGDALRFDVRSLGRFRSTDEIAALPLPGQSVRVGDVAEVTVRQPKMTFGRHLDRKFAISLQVYKESAANTVDTVERLLDRIAEIERDPALEGVTLVVWNNAGEEIRNSLFGLRDAGLFGGLLAIGVLFFFLRRVSTTAVVALAIPFSLLVTCGLMFAAGMQLNVLTMLGLMLGVGMLVDNAVVVIENIYRLQGEGLDADAAARLGTRQVTLAVLAATATTICVWSWLFLADRDPMTIYMEQIAFTICAAVFCSLVISLTFIPLAAARFVPSKPVRRGFVLRRLVPAYRQLLGWTLRHRFLTLLGLLLLASSALIPIQRVEKSAEPKLRETYVQIFLRSQDPTTLEQMQAHVGRVEEWVESRREELGYQNLYAWFREQGMGAVWVYLDPEAATEKTLAELNAKLERGLPRIPGVEVTVGEREWWRRGGSGDSTRVAVALHGDDPEYLQSLALEVEAFLEAMDDPDLREVMGPSIEGQHEAVVAVDPERAHSLGISPRRIAETVGLTFRGRNLPRYQQEGRELEMLVALPEDLQPGVATLEDLPIPRDQGDTIPLGAVATVQVRRTQPSIRRENRLTTTWVSAELSKAVTTEQAQQRVGARMAGFPLPEGYSWDWGQWGRHRDEGLANMFQGVLMSLLVVILLMAALFESFSQPLAIVVTLPLAFFGGFWALWLLGYELDVVGFMGVIILIGVVVNNGIVLVDHVNQLRRGGKERREALLEGCGDRLRPV
ncbi:MAG TPA: efflux RND transporter permease subunit, partial [Thermoanaerobaculia bacterium]|nr:efflux RND transporter permease subunit [Thermoanaerobaculia bacterium]